MSLTQEIKEKALDLGYSRVGISTVEPFGDYRKMLESRIDEYSFYLNTPRHPVEGSDPKNILPSAKSIISVVYDYSKESFPEKFLGKIGRTYLARCYTAPKEHINGSRYELMKNFLKEKGIEVGPLLPGLPERQVAARAGIVTFGKNNFAYADGIGSFIILSSFVVDVELEYDKPTVEVKCPEGCDLCMKACPTQAIYEPNKLNPGRCISYNNWWTNGRPGISCHIPYDIREKMGTRIHGCDVCQEVCPRNRDRLEMNLPQNDYLSQSAKDFSLAKVLNMSDEYFAIRIQPLMYNYIKEKKWFQRNAAIAIGNTLNPEYIPDLAQAMHDPEDIVRSHAAWALGRIGGSRAKEILLVGLEAENSVEVKSEISNAIQKINKC